MPAQRLSLCRPKKKNTHFAILVILQTVRSNLSPSVKNTFVCPEEIIVQ